MLGDPIQNPIDKGAGILGTEPLAELNGLVDGHLGRNIPTAQKFEYSYSQNVPVDPRHAAHLPMLGMFLDEVIDLIIMFHHASDEELRKRPGLLVKNEVTPEECQSLLSIPLGHINLVKNLEGRFPPASSSPHI